MDQNSDYILQKSEGTMCPVCKSTVDLLCKYDAAMRVSFYICWSCHHVAQVGVGPVRRE